MTNSKAGFFFALPAIILLIAILGFPTVAAILQSFGMLWNDADTGATIANYVAIVSDPAAWVALQNTALFVVLTVGFHLVFGLLVALLLNGNLPAKWLFRVAAILPWTIPDIITGIVWRFMLDPLAGLLNAVLTRIDPQLQPVDLLGMGNTAFLSAVAAESWRGYPFAMLILLAGLQAIPHEQYEAAHVDGATPLQRFVYITLPNLRKMIFVALVLDVIWESKVFGLVFGMTSGGPGNATDTMSLVVYRNYFEFYNTGYAAALAVTLGVVMLIVSLPYIRYTVRHEGSSQ